MCRLFAQIAPKPVDAARFLIESPQGLLAQAAPEHKQVHGWGMAHGLEVVKEPAPAHASAQFRAAAKKKAPVIIAHLREATNTTYDEANTHPFKDGNWVFAHNGQVISAPPDINDSAYYFKVWREHYKGDVYQAFLETARRFEKSYTSLNALLTDGESLYAVCHCSELRKEPAIFSKQDWRIMSYRVDGDRVLVASEPVDQEPGWKQLGPDQFLSARKAGDRVNVEVREFKP